MKRDDLIREIRMAAKARGLGFDLVRQGAAHQIYWCGSVQLPMPRHREIGPKLAFEIRKALEPELGDRWWR